MIVCRLTVVGPQNEWRSIELRNAKEKLRGACYIDGKFIVLFGHRMLKVFELLSICDNATLT